MNTNLPIVKKPPEDHPRTKFGNEEGVQFDASFYDGWLIAICYGGTAFAIRAENQQDADQKLEPLMKLNEYDVIRHCNKTDGWYVFNYHSWELVEGITRIDVYDGQGKFKETVE